mmetsp:Transcript_422/g.603  ORF Transcript_422/g.603 Transcript_422/m.603 type:complete len:110 (-) Transcript_422:561-890(-)
MYLVNRAIGALLALSLSPRHVTSFAPSQLQEYNFISSRTKATHHYSSTSEDCGCATTNFSGNPSNKAKSINVREAMRGTPFYTVNGDRTQMDDVLGKRVSVVVFLRSLG